MIADASIGGFWLWLNQNIILTIIKLEKDY